MNYKPFRELQLSRLGLGNMRFHTEEGNNDKIIYEDAFKVIDAAYAAGINYFDTAYVYNHGDSEACLGQCIKKYPRDSYYLATKFNVVANPDYEAVFEEQLQRLQTDYIDFYLLHCLLDDRADKYLDSGCIDYFLQKKAEGKIRYLGFSSHASPEILERFASHHAWDFAQIQLNYFDWAFRTAEKEYNILASRGIPVMVMEPVRGGRLAQLTPAAEAILKEAHPDWSIPSWALRFAKSLDGVQVVLSGMNSLDQLTDNCATFSDDYVFTAEDRETLFRAAETFRANLQVPCTECRYCAPECPMHINIPEFLKVYNSYKVNGQDALKALGSVESEGRPADCLHCGACAKQCPQGIAIPDIMQKLADKAKN